MAAVSVIERLHRADEPRGKERTLELLRYSSLSSHVGGHGGYFIKEGKMHRENAGIHQIPVPFSFLGYMRKLHFPTSLAIRFGYVGSSSQWKVGRSNECCF